MGQTSSQPPPSSPRFRGVASSLPVSAGGLQAEFLQDGTGEEISVLSPTLFARSWGIGASAFLIFEYIMASDKGLRLFGTSRLTGASVLYLANFVFPLITSLITMIIGFSRMSDKRQVAVRIYCAVATHANAIVGLLQYPPWAAFFGMRAYALTKHLLLALLVLVAALVPFGTNLVQFGLGFTSLNDPTVGCLVGVNLSQELINDTHTIFDTVIIASRTCIMAANALVLGITWYTMRRGYRGVSRVKTSTLAGLLLRDGTMYLASLLVLNALDLAVNLVANTEVEDSSYIMAFYEPLTAVLLSRFLIDLQAAHRKAQTLDSKNLMLHGEKSQASDRILGSLGASIVPGWLSYENTAAATNPSDAEKGNPSPSTIEVKIPQVQDLGPVKHALASHASRRGM